MLYVLAKSIKSKSIPRLYYKNEALKTDPLYRLGKNAFLGTILLM
jgi:hypothetical protein